MDDDVLAGSGDLVTAWLQHNGHWVLLLPTCTEKILEHPGEKAALWVPLSSLTLHPGLPAWGCQHQVGGWSWEQSGGHWEFRTQQQPPFLRVGKGQPGSGVRRLCCCLILQPDVCDGRWQQGNCQKPSWGRDITWEIVFLPAEMFGLAVKNISVPLSSF